MHNSSGAVTELVRRISGIIAAHPFLIARGAGMAYEAAKRLLEQTHSLAEREEAIRNAMQLGMPLHEIREFLDWLDAIRSAASQDPD